MYNLYKKIAILLDVWGIWYDMVVIEKVQVKTKIQNTTRYAAQMQPLFFNVE